jgi:exonuclease VII small subunit
MLAQGDQDSSEIRKLLATTQKQLFEAEERINKLMGEINDQKDTIKKL